METTQPRNVESPGLGQTIEKTIHDALELARSEIALAKSELSSKARSLGSAVGLLVAAVMFMQAALTSLAVLLILALRGPLPGFAVVAGFFVLGAVLAFLGIRAAKLKPLRSTARVKRDVREIAHAVKSVPQDPNAVKIRRDH